MSRLSQLSSGGGLVAYVTCGDPDLETSQAVILAAIDAGAEVIELGVPFSDPVADGPVIQRASERALRSGTTLADILRLTSEIRKRRPSAGLVLFSYFNPIFQYGIERFAADAEQAGADGVLVTDLTLEESDGYRRLMHRHGLATIFLAAPTSTDQRLKKIASACSGFIYAVSRTGVTGAQKQLTEEARQLVQRLRKISPLPVVVGFGIADREQFRQATDFADAAAVGTAIVRIIEQDPAHAPQAVAEWIQSIKRNTGTHSGAAVQ